MADQNRPEIGSTVEMPAMGDAVMIEIAEVPDEQPLIETDGIYGLSVIRG